MENNILVIGIAGGTGSGKTTLMKNLTAKFGDVVTVLSHDNYYKRHDDMTYEERAKLNYDHPDAFDTDMMIEHLKKLRAWQAIDCPTYDYTIHNRAEAVYKRLHQRRFAAAGAAGNADHNDILHLSVSLPAFIGRSHTPAAAIPAARRQR